MRGLWGEQFPRKQLFAALLVALLLERVAMARGNREGAVSALYPCLSICVFEGLSPLSRLSFEQSLDVLVFFPTASGGSKLKSVGILQTGSKNARNGGDNPHGLPR